MQAMLQQQAAEGQLWQPGEAPTAGSGYGVSGSDEDEEGDGWSTVAGKPARKPAGGPPRGRASGAPRRARSVEGGEAHPITEQPTAKLFVGHVQHHVSLEKLKEVFGRWAAAGLQWGGAAGAGNACLAMRCSYPPQLPALQLPGRPSLLRLSHPPCAQVRRGV